MKFDPPSRAFLPVRLVYAFTLLGIAAGLFALCPAARAQQFVDIGVRSKVIDKELQWLHKTDAPESGGHGKTFAILAVDEITSDERLVKPVDQEELLRQLFLQLEKNGFHKHAKGTKPDILLTLSYGRGDMKNPFMKNAEGESLLLDHVAVINGSWSQQLFDEKSPGFEANLQKAEFEKLFLRVLAWEVPKDPKSRPKMLWKTIVVADDPDHRDLNAIAAQMLEAGAPFFDKDIKGDKREINIYQPVPEGYVRVGQPKVIDPPPPTIAPRVPLRAVAVYREAEPKRKFDLPAGNAVVMLQAFSRQSGRQIIYPAGQLRAIRTNGVSGELESRDALDRMLDGTGLAAVQDEKTGALAVRPVARPPSTGT